MAQGGRAGCPLLLRQALLMRPWCFNLIGNYKLEVRGGVQQGEWVLTACYRRHQPCRCPLAVCPLPTLAAGLLLVYLDLSKSDTRGQHCIESQKDPIGIQRWQIGVNSGTILNHRRILNVFRGDSK